MYERANDTSGRQSYQEEGYPLPYQRSLLPKALLMMALTLLFFTLGHFFRFVTNLHITTLMQNPGSVFLNTVLYSISSLFLLLFFIFIIVTIILFFVGKDEVNAKHSKNVTWAFFLMIAFIITYILGFIVGFSIVFSIFISRSLFIFSSAFFEVISIIEGFLIAFLLFLPVKELARPRGKDALYIFASLIIIVAVLQSIIAIIRAPIENENFIGTIYLWTFYEFLFFILGSLGFIIMFRMYKRNKTSTQQIPEIPSKSFLPRPQPIARYAYTFYSRPLQAFIIILILAIILGAGRGLTIDLPFLLDNDNFNFDVNIESGGPYTYEESEMGSLAEGQTDDHSFSDSSDVATLAIWLYWEDEPDMGFRNNEPDRFSLNVDFGMYSESFTGENADGGVGNIGNSWEFGPGEFDSGISIDIQVTLNDAGEQVGPAGIPRSPATVQDDSNDYTISIYYEYFDPNYG